MSRPATIAPTSEPTSAPTIPPQKRSGSQIVKCQMDRPIMNQPSRPISPAPRFPRDAGRAPPTAALRRSSRPPVTAVARAPALPPGLGLVLEHEVLGSEVGRRIATRRGLIIIGLRRRLAGTRSLRHDRPRGAALRRRDVGADIGRRPIALAIAAGLVLDIELAHE